MQSKDVKPGSKEDRSRPPQGSEPIPTLGEVIAAVVDDYGADQTPIKHLYIGVLASREVVYRVHPWDAEDFDAGVLVV